MIQDYARFKLLLLLPVEEPYLNNCNPNKHENLHVYIFFLTYALSGFIFVNLFTFCDTDHYQHKQCIIMETETEKKLFYLVCVCNNIVIFSLTLLLLVLLIVICPSNTLLGRPLSALNTTKKHEKVASILGSS